MDERRLLLFSLGSWLILMVLGVLNGIIRVGLYADSMTDLQAHQLSTFTLMVIILLFTYVLIRFKGFDMTQRQALIMGVIWTVSTIAFEFIAGHYVFGHSWDALLADYDILSGKVWVLIPLTTLVAPYIVRRIIR